MSVVYIGLDGEMSDNNIDKGAALIQIGFAVLNETGLTANYSDLNPSAVDNGSLHWSPEAAAVHNIPIQRVMDSKGAEVVDDEMYTWLLNVAGLNPDKRIKNIPVGWNVSAFDMPYLRKYLPLTHSLFSRRTADLNAICFALDGKDDKTFKWWKSASKAYAEEKSPPTEGFGEHNAGWDAIMSIYCFEYLRNAVKGI